MSATRISSRPAGRVVAVQRARLRVARGPSRGGELELSSLAPIVIGSDADADLLLADDTVSRRHAEVRPTARGWMVRDLGSTNGVRIDGVRVRRGDPRRRRAELELGETELECSSRSTRSSTCWLARDRFGGLVGDAPAMRALFALLERAAATDATVLLEGETGTGKERASREALHRALGARTSAPFVVVDCGALPPTLVESELFGHEKGAFTGADRARAGRVRARPTAARCSSTRSASCRSSCRPSCLRVLEAREVRRVGATTPQPVDVRVIAATHRDLDAAWSSRAASARICTTGWRWSRCAVPPLRERPRTSRCWSRASPRAGAR